MRNACPKCDTVYAVTPRDVGRRIVCKRCSSTLVIDADGFRIEGAPPPEPVSAPPAESRDRDKDRDRDRDKERPIRVPRESRLGPLWAGLWANIDASTVAFGAGVFLVIISLFMPLIGKAKVDRRQGTIAEERLYIDDQIKQLRATKPVSEEVKRNADERIAKLEEGWVKRREALELEVKHAEVGNQVSVYWDRYWLLLGFLLLAGGAIGFMRDTQPLIKRIVGAVVVCSQMLIVFGNLLAGCGKLPGV